MRNVYRYEISQKQEILGRRFFTEVSLLLSKWTKKKSDNEEVWSFSEILGLIRDYVEMLPL